MVFNKESEVEVTQLCLTLTIPWTVAHQALLSMEFSRQEYWIGLPFPTPLTKRSNSKKKNWYNVLEILS